MGIVTLHVGQQAVGQYQTYFYIDIGRQSPDVSFAKRQMHANRARAACNVHWALLRDLATDYKQQSFLNVYCNGTSVGDSQCAQDFGAHQIDQEQVDLEVILPMNHHRTHHQAWRCIEKGRKQHRDSEALYRHTTPSGVQVD